MFYQFSQGYMSFFLPWSTVLWKYWIPKGVQNPILTLGWTQESWTMPLPTQLGSFPHHPRKLQNSVPGEILSQPTLDCWYLFSWQSRGCRICCCSRTTFHFHVHFLCLNSESWLLPLKNRFILHGRFIKSKGQDLDSIPPRRRRAFNRLVFHRSVTSSASYWLTLITHSRK